MWGPIAALRVVDHVADPVVAPPIEITSRGRLNLHKYDNKLQAQLERYLVKVGILQKGQTLSAQELLLQARRTTGSGGMRVNHGRGKTCACATAKTLAQVSREDRAEERRTGRVVAPCPPTVGTRKMGQNPALRVGSRNGNAQARADFQSLHFFSSLGVFEMTRKNQWVVPVNGGDQWGVRGEGNDRITSIHDTQQEAIDRARGIAINQQSELFIQGRDGQIRERNSYGNDPFPPKG
jgi:hypothetical protein